MSRYIFQGATEEEDYRKKLYEMSQLAQNKPKTTLSGVKTKNSSRAMTAEEITLNRASDKEVYERAKEMLTSEKKEANKVNFKKFAAQLGLGALYNQGVVTEDVYNKSRVEHQKSKKIKDTYARKPADLDNTARHEFNVSEQTEQLKDEKINSRVGELYKSKLAVDGQKSVGNNQASYESMTAYKEMYDQLRGEGYDVETLLDVYGRQANRKTAEHMNNVTSEFVKDSTGKAVLAIVGSVVLNAVSGSGMMGAIESKGKELLSGEPSPIDTNSKYFAAGNIRDTIRNTIDEEIQKNIDNETLKGIASFTYRTGMSMGDFLSVSWMPSPVSLSIMAGSAASSATKQVVENGGTTSQALMTGLMAGGAEILFEKLSLDNFKALKNLKVNGGHGFSSFAVNVLKQSGIEGTEEMFTDIANSVSDNLINGGMSRHNLAVEQYKANGMTDEEAKSKANMDFVKQVGMSFAGGALSGGVIGSLGSAVGNSKYNSYTKEIGRNIQATNGVQATVDNGLATDKDARVYQLAEKMADKIRNDKKISPFKVGQLHNETASMNYENNIQPAVRDRLVQLNANDENNVVADTIVRMLDGEKISVKDSQLVQNSKEAQRVISEYKNSYNPQFTNDWTTKINAPTNVVQNANSGNSNAPQEAIKGAFDSDVTSSKITTENLPNSPTVNSLIKPNVVRLLADDKTVEIKEIVKTSNGKAVLKTADNGTVKIDEVEFSSPETRVVYETALQMPTKDVSNKFVRAYNANKEDGGTANLELFNDAFRILYKKGKQGNDYKTVMNASGYVSNGSMSLRSASQAFYAGQEASKKTNAVVIGSKKYEKGVTVESKKQPSAIQEMQVRNLNTIAKKVGVSVVIADGFVDNNGFDSFNGAYKDNTVYINLSKTGDAINYVAGHELLHHIKANNADGYKTLEKVIISSLENAKNYNFDEEVQKMINLHWELGNTNFTKVDAVEEIVAESCFDVLSNEKNINKIIEQDKTLAETIKDWLTNFIAKLKEVASQVGKNRAEHKALHNDIEALDKINDTFYNALLGTKKADTNSDGEVKYSIETIENTNKKYVKADRQVISGNDVGQWKKAVENYINNDIRHGKDVNFTAVDGDVLTITADTAGKATFRNEITLPGGVRRRMTNEEFASKLRAETHIDELSQVSERGGKVIPDYKNHSFAKDGFNYRTAFFEDIDGQYYKIVISVGINGNINSVYNVGKMQNKKSKTSISGSKAARKTALESLANTNISQDNNGVNSYDMQNDKNNAKFMLPSRDSSENDVQLYRNQQYVNEIKALNRQIEILKQQFKITKGHKLSEKAIDGFTKRMLNKYKSDYDFDTFKTEITLLFEYIANAENVDWDNIVYQGSKMAKSLLSQSSTLDNELWNESKNFRQWLKTTPISFTENQKSEIANYYGSFESFRKSLFGSMNITSNGIELDAVWSEISNRNDFGYFFDIETHELEQPIRLKEFLEMVKPTYINTYEMDMDTSSLSVGLEIYDAFFDIGEVHTFADKKLQELKRLKGQYRSRMGEWKDEYRTKYKEKLLQTKIDLKKKAISDKNEALLKQKVHYQIIQKNAKNRRDNTAIRHKILRARGRLTLLLKENSEKKHVPVELIKSVVDVLETLNMDTHTSEEKIESLRQQIYNSPNDNERRELQKKYDRIVQRDVNLAERLATASNLYEKLKESESYFMQTAYDESIGGDINDLREIISDTPINKLSTYQLEKTYEVFREIEHAVQNANKTFKDEKASTIEGLGLDIINELEKMKRPGARPKFVNRISEMGWAMFRPIDAIQHIGSDTLSIMYSKVKDGESTWAVDVNQAREFRLGQYNSVHASEKVLKTTHTVKLNNGEVITVTTDEAMSMYAYSRREQAVKHLLGGGFQFAHDTLKTPNKEDGAIEKYVSKHLYTFKSKPHNLTLNDIKTIAGLLSKEQQLYVKNMQNYLSEVMGAKGNEVTLAMYGIKKFNEKNYFPIKSSDEFLDSKSKNAVDGKLKNRSFTKKATATANNAVVLEKFSEAWAKHCDEMSLFHAFTLPIEDFTRVYNFKTRVTEDSGGMSIKNELESLYGNGANGYIKNLISDINGNARADRDTSIPAKTLRMFKKGATYASASVTIQQASSIARAFSVINPKYFVVISNDNTSIFKPKTWEEVKKYAPVAIIKEMGHFDINMGSSTVDWINQPEYSWKEKPKAFFKDGNYRDDVLSLPPSKADELTWCTIWNATQLEVQDKQGLKLGTEENKVASGKRFTEIIDLTQVYDSTLSRSQLMRSKSLYINMATSFMAEPTVSLNRLVSGFYEAKRNGKDGKKVFGRVIGSFVCGELLRSLLVSLVYASRDDDEKKKWSEKYVREVTETFLGGLNPFSMIPFVKDIISICQGYNVERTDIDVIQELYYSAQKMFDDETTSGEKIEEFLKSVSTFLGVPLKNLLRDWQGIKNIIASAKLDKSLTATDYKYAVRNGAGKVIGKKYTTKSEFKRLYEAKAKGDQKTYDEIYYILKQSGKSDKKIISGLRSAMAEYDSRVMEAAKLKDKSDFVGQSKIVKEIEKVGFSYNDVAKAVNSAFTKLKKGEIEEDEDSKEAYISAYSYENLNGAIESGDTEAVELIVQEKIDVKISNGGTKKKAITAIKEQITSYWKPEYIASTANEKFEIRKKLLSAGVYESSSDLDAVLKRWRKDAE